MRLNNYTVPNKEFKISVDMEFDASSLGAQTSSTESAHKGIKPKAVSVNLLIPHVNASDLTALTSIAESTGTDGSLTTYTVTDPLCNAMNIRKVTFAKNFTVADDMSLKAWRVSFSLVEYNSVPEKAEQRTTTKTTQIQSADGVDVGDSSKELTGFEKILLFGDNLFKPSV